MSAQGRNLIMKSRPGGQVGRGDFSGGITKLKGGGGGGRGGGEILSPSLEKSGVESAEGRKKRRKKREGEKEKRSPQEGKVERRKQGEPAIRLVRATIREQFLPLRPD